MKAAVAQIAPSLGNMEKNFELHLQVIEKARKEKADLVVFPELSLTGYLLKDLVEEVALVPEKNRYFREFKKLSLELDIVLGFVEEKERGVFFNSAAYIHGRRILHIHRKVFLPTFGMFEEGKFFASGKNFWTFKTPFARTGMMICRDFLHLGSNYLLFAGGSEMIIVISAAPGRGVSGEGRFETCQMWDLMGEAVSRFATTFVIYCNRVGFEDGLSFAGGSYVFNPMGNLVARASDLDTDLLLCAIDPAELRRARKNWTFKRDDKPEIICEALKRIVAGHED